MNKRSFIKNSIALLGTPYGIKGVENLVNTDSSPANNEDKWEAIRADYQLFPFNNLENGYYCVVPKPILAKFKEHVDYVNGMGSMYMRTEQTSNKEKARKALGEMLGCSHEELALTRNTTESLDTIISGMDWKTGDEAIMSNQDYGSMLAMFDQVKKRHDIELKKIDVPLDPESDEEIIKVYESQITPKTKLIMVCHMINITGHILPIRKICDMAHSYGVKVMVDGAHCVAHINFNISELNCDFYGASLHKWLSNPLGAGILYVKKENIPSVWPLLAPGPKEMSDITRLNHTGTLPVYTDLTIHDSIAYYQKIGPEEKENRLRFLQNIWTDKLRDVTNLIVNTPRDKSRSCGIGNIGVKNIKPVDLSQILHKEFKIYTVAIDYEQVKGVRVTPNVYTTEKEMNEFVDAMVKIAKR